MTEDHKRLTDRELLKAAMHALRSYQYGNSATDTAKVFADRIELQLAYPVDPAPPQEVDIQALVNRFLGWKVPKDFAPDAGISYVPPAYATDAAGVVVHYPVGTNLLNAVQAEAMLKYVVLGIESPQ